MVSYWKAGAFVTVTTGRYMRGCEVVSNQVKRQTLRNVDGSEYLASCQLVKCRDLVFWVDQSTIRGGQKRGKVTDWVET